jgi:hypothetical protein
VQYAISNALGELDARRGTPSDSQARMDALLNSVLGYRDGLIRQNPVRTRVKGASRGLGATAEQSTEPVDNIVDN